MLFTSSHTERISFTPNLFEAVQKLYYHGYFSYLNQAYNLRHWGLITHQKKLTLKGIRFARGDIGIEKTIVVCPRYPKDPDPEIIRGDSFIFMEDPDAQV